MSNVTVLCPNGRRQQVKVEAQKKVLQVIYMHKSAKTGKRFKSDFCFEIFLYRYWKKCVKNKVSPAMNMIWCEFNSFMTACNTHSCLNIEFFI
jgi:hypothetical protein